MAAPQIKSTFFINESSSFGILCVNIVTISHIYMLSISYLTACYPCCEGITDADTELLSHNVNICIQESTCSRIQYVTLQVTWLLETISETFGPFLYAETDTLHEFWS